MVSVALNFRKMDLFWFPRIYQPKDAPYLIYVHCISVKKGEMHQPRYMLLPSSHYRVVQNEITAQ